MSRASTFTPEKFATFGELLRFLRRKADLTQRELAIAVGYSESQISRLEKNERAPEEATLAARFVPALYIEDEPQWIARLLELGAATHAHTSDDESLHLIAEAKPTPHNLPIQLTSFIGREKEIEQIKKWLEKNRLVTLTGSGGVGKTRLSIQVASELLIGFPNGVWLVELAPITDPTLVIRTVCAALDLTPQGNTPPLNVLTEYLKSKKTLLVIDNCEHLIDACAQLSEVLLHACPDLRIIASSREALGIEGESAYRVPSLSLADPGSRLEIIEQSEAVRLFIERANTLLPGYALTEVNAPTITQICQRLDGIALAIELAASRIRLLKVDQIKARLDDAFRLLTSGSRTALPRQQTLRGTIDWSYNLLTEEERRSLQSLCVFVGGWTLEAAEAIGGNADMLDLLTHLVDKSLVVVDREHRNEPRYYLLETIRQYAREKLAASGEGEQVRARHLDYFLKLAQRAEPELYGAGQIEWSQKLEDEYENTRAALEWSLQGNVSMGQQLAAALWWSWNYSGHLREGYEWLKKMLAVNSDEETLIRAKLLSGAGWLAAMLSYSEQAIAFSEASIDLFRRLGDKQSIAFPLATLGTQAYHLSDYVQATTLFEESCALFRETGNKWGVRHTLGGLGYTAESQGDFEKAQKYYDESLSICKEIGDYEGRGWTLYLMGRLAEKNGEDAQAIDLYQEALETEKEVKSKPLTAWILGSIGVMLIRRGEYERGKLSFEEAIEINRRMGEYQNLWAHVHMAHAVLRKGDIEQARAMFQTSIRDTQKADLVIALVFAVEGLASLYVSQNQPERAAQLFAWTDMMRDKIGDHRPPVEQASVERDLGVIHSKLNDTEFASLFAEGRAMTIEQAIQYALEVENESEDFSKG